MVDIHDHEVMHELLRKHGDCFAFELGLQEGPPEPIDPEAPLMGPGLTLERLAWRRWPSPDARKLPSARAAHERARAWVAKCTRVDDGVC